VQSGELLFYDGDRVIQMTWYAFTFMLFLRPDLVNDPPWLTCSLSGVRSDARSTSSQHLGDESRLVFDFLHIVLRACPKALNVILKLFPSRSDALIHSAYLPS
jgi:hypothetical protein